MDALQLLLIMVIMYEITDYIIQSVAKFYGITVNELKNGGRYRKYSDPRHVAEYCIYEFTGLSYNRISKMFGKKSHRTIMYAVAKVDDWRKNPKLNQTAADCIEYVFNHQE